MRPRCIMKPVEGAGVAADNDRAALLVDAGAARRPIALADEIAAAQRRAELASRHSSR